MNLKSLIAAGILLTGLANWNAASAVAEDAGLESPKDFVEHMSFTLGKWHIVDHILQPSGERIVKEFIVEATSIADGNAMMSDWYTMEGEYFGTVINGLNPEGNSYTTNYFNAPGMDWSHRKQVAEITENGIILRFTDTDNFGPFESVTELTKVSDDEHKMNTRRSYNGGQNWINIDNYVAKRVE